jgi:cyclopropane-fatty-acyl-phospholipid synthase
MTSIPAEAVSNPFPELLDRLAKAVVLAQLSRLEHGCLTLVDRAAVRTYGRRSPHCNLHATIRVHDARTYREVAFGGSIGAGESYMRGHWSTDDLVAVMRLFLQNLELLDGMEGGWARLAVPMRKGLHWLRRNTRVGSRRNIAAHYDLGNEFFALMLDPTMMYSCAVFERPGLSLEQASIAKLDRVCRRLAIRSDDHVLEIGAGWGGFALHAASRYGCRVTTTTISRRQFERVCQRVADANLTDRVTVLFEDYRDLRGQYDRLVSIEMIEAVGHKYFNAYFRKCSDLLKPDGAMLLQAIVIADQRYEMARKAVDFIQRHIFPGSGLPSVSVLCNAAARETDMRLAHLEDIGPDYAATLGLWRQNLFSHLDEIRALGLSEQFIRMWQFYLCYCEAGFEERTIGDVQALFVKPRCRLEPAHRSLARASTLFE